VKLAAFALVLASGCYDTAPGEFNYEPLEQQEVAIAEALKVYGYSGPHPTIAWVERLDCDGGYLQDGNCVRGGYTDGHANVYLARIYDWWTPYALAHELSHFVQYRTEGKATHNAPWFNNNDQHQPCEKIKEATKAVAAILGL
jgi:hypothetical protein